MEESASTEYVTLEESLPGPEMQVPLFAHAMVGINLTHSLIVGGVSDAGHYCDHMTKTTYYFDHIGKNWIVGPELLYYRSLHDVGIVRDKVMNQTLVVVTGGCDYERAHLTLSSDGEGKTRKLIKEIQIHQVLA